MNAHIFPKYKQEKRNSVNKTKKYSFYKSINSPKPSQIKSTPGFKTPLKSTKANIKYRREQTVGNQKNIFKYPHTIPHRNKDSYSATSEKTKSFTLKKNNNNDLDKNKDKFNKTFIHPFNNNNNENALKRKHSITNFSVKEKEKLNKDIIIKNNKKGDNNSQIKNKNNILAKRILKTEGNQNNFNFKDKLRNRTYERKKSKKYKNGNSSS